MSKLTRRELIKRLSVGLAAAPALVACATQGAAADKKTVEARNAQSQPQVSASSEGSASNEGASQPDAAGEQASEATTEAAADNTDAASTEAELDCTDTTGLSEQQVHVREALNYTDDSSRPNQTCSNCQLWEEAQVHGHCGGCKTVPGPIHPEGWCSAWVSRS